MAEKIAAEFSSFLTKKVNEETKETKKDIGKLSVRKRKAETQVSSEFSVGSLSKEDIINLVKDDPVDVCNKILAEAGRISDLKSKLEEIGKREAEIDAQIAILEKEKRQLKRTREEMSEALLPEALKKL